MEKVELNLSEEVLKEMKNLGFKETSIEEISNAIKIDGGLTAQPKVQKMLLTMIFFKVLLRAVEVAPSKIRYSLNGSSDFIDWLQDIKIVILPFLKENEEKFFPSK